MSEAPAGWYPDPLGRHQHRYWDGGAWTEHVASDRQQASDPLAAPPAPSVAPAVSKSVQRPSLFTESVLVVSQKPKLIEVNAEYAIFDQNGNRIGSVQEVGRTLMKNLLGPVPTSSKAKRLNVLDAGGQVLLTLSRPAAIVRSIVTVRRSDGTEIGQIIQRVTFAKAKFILESGGKAVGAIEGEDWNLWDFSLQDAAGDEVAHISKSLSGFGLHRSNKKDRYVVQIHRQLEDPLHSLVVAAALTIDTVLRQR
jgi:uncharacterized protein YxjI